VALKFIVGVCVFAAALSGPSGLGMGPIAGQAASETPSPRLDEAVRFRTQMGFDARPTFVESTLHDSLYDSSLWGVPLSMKEQADLSNRMSDREQLEDAISAATAREDFGGIYLDQKRGGLPVFLTTGSPSAFTAAIDPKIPADIAFEVVAVDRTYAALETLQGQLDADRDQLRKDGIDLRGVGIQPSGNTVVVGVPEPSDAISKDLRARYGPGITVRAQQLSVADAETCLDIRRCMPELKGGIKTYIEGDALKFCTTGWLGRRTDTGSKVILTAGHCLMHGDGVDDNWWHWTYEIGGELKSTFAQNARADVGLVQKASAITVTKYNRVLDEPTSGLNGIRSVTSFQANSSQLQGDVVCRVGVASLKTCGQIKRVNESNPSVFGAITYNIQHTWVVDFDSTAGDSGGPVFRYTQQIPPNVIGYGTHVHSDPDGTPNAEGWYSPTPWGRIAYDDIASYTFDLCTTASC
jgi:hypothetical protein